MKKLNLNRTVYVQLNDYGKELYFRHYDKNPEVDDCGFTKFQLYDFMRIYGRYFSMWNSKLPLDDYNIYIEEQALEEMCKYE